MGKSFILITLLIIICGYATFGNLITKPNNSAPYVDLTRFSMNCSSTLGSNNITWYLEKVGESNNVTIASGSIVSPAVTYLYSIDQPTNSASNLIIQRNEATAGIYTCADSEMVAHAQVLFLFDFPVSYNASDNLIDGDVISISCSVRYVGNSVISPFFKLYDSSTRRDFDISTSPELNITGSWTMAEATFYLTVSCPVLPVIHCVTGFRTLVGNLLPSSATNDIPYFSAVYLSQWNVLCVPTDKNLRIDGAMSGSVLYFGNMLTCNVTTVPSANYSWTDLTYGNSSIGPDLTVWHDGSYRCTASNYVNGSWYSGSKTLYNLTIEKVSFTAKPLYGPIAGGTNVTVTLENWSKQVTNVSAVYLGDILTATVLESNRTSNSFMMNTSSATPALIGQPLPITIEFVPGPYNITTNLSFTYQGNPEITGISPTTFIVTGGMLVTATGTNLSSVANTLIEATVVVERGIEKNTTQEISFESCEVIPGNGSTMICRMPRVMIPGDFLQILDSQRNNRMARGTNSMNHITAKNLSLLTRRRRFSNALSLIGPNGVDRIAIYIGFILDGYRKYKNINDVIPETQILFFSPPQINSSKDILEFDPNEDEFIAIKGEHMTRCCRIADYLVHVGSDICNNSDLYDNQLSCRPPKIKPPTTLNDTINCDQKLSVKITVGYLQYQYACITYTDPSLNRKVALIVGLTVGLVGFVFFLAILIACVVRCCRGKSSEQSDNQNESRRHETRHFDSPMQLESLHDDQYLRQHHRSTIIPNDEYLTSIDGYRRQEYDNTLETNDQCLTSNEGYMR